MKIPTKLETVSIHNTTKTCYGIQDIKTGKVIALEFNTKKEALEYLTCDLSYCGNIIKGKYKIVKLLKNLTTSISII